MVDLKGQAVPETEAEWALLRDVYDVTGDAFEDGVGEEEIATILHFAALSILAFGGEQVEEVPEGPVDTRRSTCPSCGEEIEDVSPFIGGDVSVEPCGCTVTVHQVPGWIDT